jgi:hypothetical protein
MSQRFADSTRLLLGKINAIDLLARHPFLGGWGTDRFWNVAFVAPPSGVVPPVIMGGILTHSSAAYTLTAMVFDPNDQTTNDSFNGLFEDGVNVSLGLAWAGPIAGRRSGTGITATYSTAERADLSQVGLSPALQTTRKKGSYNVTVQVSHLLVESTRVRGQGLGLYAPGGGGRRQPESDPALFRRWCRRPPARTGLCGSVACGRASRSDRPDRVRPPPTRLPRAAAPAQVMAGTSCSRRERAPPCGELGFRRPRWLLLLLAALSGPVS